MELQWNPIIFPSILTPGVTQSGVRMEFCSLVLLLAVLWWKWVGLGFPHTFHPAVKVVSTPWESKSQRSLQEGLKLFSASQIRMWFFSHFLCDHGQTLQLPPEGLRRRGYKVLQNPALLLFLSKNIQLFILCFIYIWGFSWKQITEQNRAVRPFYSH